LGKNPLRCHWIRFDSIYPLQLAKNRTVDLAILHIDNRKGFTEVNCIVALGVHQIARQDAGASASFQSPIGGGEPAGFLWK
jgi:hypothetical protein